MEKEESRQIDRGKVRLRSADFLVGPSYDASIEDDGTFAINSASAGRYILEIDPPSGTYVKAVRYSGKEIEGRVVDFANSVHDLDIVLRRGAARLRGAAAQEEPAGNTNTIPVSLGAYFAVVPRGEMALWSDIRSGYCDSQGGFSIDGLAPGHYRVFTWTAADPRVFWDPNSLRELDRVGLEVKLNEGDASVVRAPLLRRDEVDRLIGALR
ncbi:MAG: hypothetical protein ACK5AZ_26085 [Bryobacteraceae bacterium]